jgi:hypothetical protein
MSETLNSVKACNDRLAQLGEKRRVFSNLKQAQAAVSAAEKSKLPVVAKVAAKATAPTIAGLKAALKTAKTAGERLEVLGSLRASLANQLASVGTDMTRQSELARELNLASKLEAYEILAMRTEDPKAYKARQLRQFANLD